MLFDDSIPSILRTIFAVPNVTLMNIMACRVFRNTILFEDIRGTDFYGHLISMELKVIREGEAEP
jgi:hypothetical protein